MKHDNKKIMGIIDEVMTFLYCVGAKEINIHTIKAEDKYVIEIKSDYLNKNKSKVEDMIDTLSTCQRQIELEEYYWELVGDSEVGTELTLVGAMVDEIDIDLEDDSIEITLIRNRI